MFAWSDFYDLATLLSTQSELSEASQRTAISRAYYAAFHASRDFLIQQQRFSALTRNRVHFSVWGALSNSDSEVEQRLGQLGYRLMRIRHRADYDLLYPDLARELALTLRSVAWLIEEVIRISQSDPSS